MYTIFKNFNLKEYNTFGISACADNFIEVSSLMELVSVVQNVCPKYNKHFILGGGSNILLTKDIDGLTIKNNIVGIELLSENDENVELKVYSGTVWHDLVTYCVEHHFQGIENLALIPGTVGAAPMQNIGAYGVEISSVLRSVHVVDMETAELQSFSNEDCKFGYRESIFKNIVKNKYFIYAIDLILKKKNYTLNIDYGDIKNTLIANNIHEPSIKDVYQTVIQIRNSKLPNPKDLGNAGSFFKNPEIDKITFDSLIAQYSTIPHYILKNNTYKIPAAWLIEQCGFKGKIVGNTGNHAKQALVIVNYGNADGNEILQHANNVIETVRQKFGIVMTPEVNIIPN